MGSSGSSDAQFDARGQGMNVVGTGVDLVEVERFSHSIERWGDRLLRRLFAPSELAYAQGRKSSVQHLAARFAAKEAVVKALGAPKGLGLKWVDLVISNNPQGQPQVSFLGTLSRWADHQVQLSLTHTKQFAVATALVLKA